MGGCRFNCGVVGGVLLQLLWREVVRGEGVYAGIVGLCGGACGCGGG